MSDRSVVIGIDPGQSTGVAIFVDGVLTELCTLSPVLIAALINPSVSRVIFEDSRLQSHIWAAPKASRAAGMKIARNVGQIDAWCSLIVALCEAAKVDCHGISPKSKGAKLNAAQFEAMTGWAGKSNQHERDAACVAWMYRRAA